MRSATLNLYSAALYHLTEQHLVDLCLMILGYDEHAEVTPWQAIGWLKDQLDCDVKQLLSWSVIDELRLVANAVKHGEGHSAADLHQLRPDLFVLPHLKVTEIETSRLRVRKPLFGQDIYVSANDFVKYHEGSVAFWNEVADQRGAVT